MKAEVVVCPPALLLAYLRGAYKGKRIGFGVQDITLHPVGAHTGEVTAELALTSGATYAIIGHAERRAEGETDEIVTREVRAALDAGLRPIVCVGEAERDRDGKYFSVLEKTVAASLSSLLPHELAKVVIAYEPVWAIGAAVAPEGRVVAEAMLYIRKTIAAIYGREAALKAKIIYGGAVDDTSASGLLENGHTQGFLVGRASVDAEKFIGIIRACES